MRIGPFGKKVAGYCHVCGSLEDEQHLTQHEEKSYCSRCYRPIAAKQQEEARREEIRKRHGKHHLLVEFRDGRREQGRAMAMNIKEPFFRLECEDDRGATTGRTVRVEFSDVKCVRNVKNYTGKPDSSPDSRVTTPDGMHVVVEFEDGELLEGSATSSIDGRTQRFYVIPLDPRSNAISVLVEMAAVKGVYSPEEYRNRRAAVKETKTPRVSKDATPVGQDESMGDFYFETHNYPAALEQYETALSQNPGSKRISKKMTVATINIGIQFIKQRDYRRALDYMTKALELEPGNPHAEKKAKQLRKTIEKTEKRMREYTEQHAARKQPPQDTP